MQVKTFIQQLIHYFPAQIAPAIINVVIIAILTRSFTVEIYGDYVLITTIVTFIITVLTQWLIQSILYFRPKYIESGQLEEFDSQLANVINKFVIFIFGILLFLIIVNLLVGGLVLYIFALLLILVQSVFTIELVILQSDMKSAKYTKRVFISNILRLALIILLAFIGIDIEKVLLVLIISYGIFIIPNIGRYVLINTNYTSSSRSFIRKMLTYGLPMLGWFLSVSLMNVGDRFLIKYFQGSEAVGLYTGNYTIIVASLGLVFIPLTMVIHSMLMKFAVNIKEQKEEIELFISKFTTIFFIVGVPVILLVFKFRKEIAFLFLGEPYVEASNIIPIVMIGIFLWNLAMIGHKGIEILNKTKVMFYFAITSCTISFLLNTILIQKFSYIGAAYGNMIAFSIYCILVYVYSLKLIRWRWNIKEITIVLICGSIMIISLNLFDISLQADLRIGVLKIILISIFTMIIYVTLIVITMKKKLINIKF